MQVEAKRRLGRDVVVFNSNVMWEAGSSSALINEGICILIPIRL